MLGQLVAGQERARVVVSDERWVKERSWEDEVRVVGEFVGAYIANIFQWQA